MRRKLFALFLMMVLILTSIPAEAVRANDNFFTDVQCGDDAYATLDAEGRLVITGRGKMWDAINDAEGYDYHECPWEKYKDNIKTVVFEGEVTYVGAGTMMACFNLTSVVLNDYIEDIAEFAFSSCDKLRDIVWPETMQAIRQEAFAGTAVEEIVLPDGISFFDGSAFSYCRQLKKITIGTCDADVFIMGFPAFKDCTSLETIIVPEEHFALTVEDNVLYGARRTPEGKKIPVSLYVYPAGKKDKTYTIPDTVIDNQQWSNASNSYLEEVIFPEGFTRIANNTFESCRNLKNVEIPESVTTIDMSVFRYCTSLENITLPEGLTVLGDWAFFGCKNLKSIALPKGINTIKQYTFEGCSGLQSIELSNNLISIEDRAFYDCDSLTSVELPNGVTNIGFAAFSCCNNLKKIVIPKTTTTIFDNAFEETNNIAIHGYVDSYAYEYAMEKDIPFIDVETGMVVNNPFEDIEDDQYYYDPVLWAYSNNITSGLTATTFGPDKSCTRGQIVTFLWRAMGCPEPKLSSNPFTDVPAKEYYTKAVLWAVENGITTGLSQTKFGPEETCTRAQIVTFLWRAFGEQEPESTVNNFVDVPANAYYTKAVLWAVENGITTGLNATTFGPDAYCSRGQVVTFLYRACKE